MVHLCKLGLAGKELQRSEGMTRHVRTYVPILAAVVASTWCLWMNVSPRFYSVHSNEETGPRLIELVSSKYSGGYTRALKLQGWPQDFHVHLGWIGYQEGDRVMLDLRPRREEMYVGRLLVNLLAGIALACGAYFVFRLVLERKISLRGIMVFVACIAVLTTFAWQPTVKLMTEHREMKRMKQELEQMQNRMGRRRAPARAQ